jgi:hypothetical protein
MSDDRTETTLELASQLGAAARATMRALDAVIAAGAPPARDTERHLLRLRFSLARVNELRERVARTGGVFEPARLEVALSILDVHIARAERFCEQIAPRTPKAARRISSDAPAAEPADTAAPEQRAA